MAGELARKKVKSSCDCKSTICIQEEEWTGLEGGAGRLRVSGPCRRCAVIRVEQGTGEVTKEPLRSLAAFKNRNFNFGVHTWPELAAGDSWVIRVGDLLDIS